MRQKTLKIEGMSCHHCVMAMRKSFQMVDGMQNAEVEVGQATLEFDESKVTDKDISKAVARAGFKVQEH